MIIGNKTIRMKVKLTLLLLMTSTWLSAQKSSEVPVFNLDQCMDYSLEHATDVQNAVLDELSAGYRVKETVGIGLPQVTGSVTAQKSPRLSRFFSTYDPANPGFLSDEGAEALQDAGAQTGDVYAVENFFQLPASGDASLSINQLIFNGSYIVGLQASKAYKDLAVKQKEYISGERKATVAKAYFGVLINDDRLDLARTSVDRLEKVYSNTVALKENGFAEKIDVDRLKVALNNAKSDLDNLQRLLKYSMNLLKFQMNYPQNEPLRIEGKIKDVVEQVSADFNNSIVYQDRRDYRVLLANKQLQELNIKNKYAESLPVLSAFANVGYSTQSDDFGGLFRRNSNFSEVGAAGPDKWYRYSALGLSLNWSLFTGLQKRYQVQQQKVELDKIDNNIEMMENQIQLETLDSETSLVNALSKLAVQEENLELATSIFEISQKKYEEGVGSNLEVVEANTALIEAQTNYYNALFEAIVARVDLSRALGRIE